MTDKELISYIEQHAFISDEVKDIMLILIKERDYCLTLPNDITKVKDLIGYLRCVPQENVLMIETDAEDVLDKAEVVLDIDDILVGHGTNFGISFLKIEGLKELTDKVKEETINEFTHQLKESLNQEFPLNYDSTRPYFTLENARMIVDDVAKIVNERNTYDSSLMESIGYNFGERD